MMTVLNLIAWESGSDVKNRLADTHRGKQGDECLQIMVTELIHKLH